MTKQFANKSNADSYVSDLELAKRNIHLLAAALNAFEESLIAFLLPDVFVCDNAPALSAKGSKSFDDHSLPFPSPRKLSIQ